MFDLISFEYLQHTVYYINLEKYWYKMQLDWLAKQYNHEMKIVLPNKQTLQSHNY